LNEFFSVRINFGYTKAISDYLASYDEAAVVIACMLASDYYCIIAFYVASAVVVF